jgi:hypothetical protein
MRITNTPNLVIGALLQAKREFGEPSTWDTERVARWVQRKVQDAGRVEQPIPPSWHEPQPRVLTPLVPDDEREALMSEDGWR